MPAIRRLVFVVHDGKPGATELTQRLVRRAHEYGVETQVSSSMTVPPGFLDHRDACVVVGGDGTLLSVVQEAVRAQVPIIGINRGSLGFLTTFTAEEAEAGFKSILDGNYRIDERVVLECRAGDNVGVALNEVLIREEVPSRIAHLEVHADDELITNFFCDGLILSTPTGSTAYNLSAGGPLLHPHVDAVALTPICPHTLSNRTVIFPNTVRLRVNNRGTDDSVLLVALDGHSNQFACGAGPIEIGLAPVRLQLAVPVDYEHFRVVRTKLKWSGGVR